MDDRLINRRYDLLKVIGQGAMGKVWHGHDRLLDRDVAVKEVLFGPGLSDAERLELAEPAMVEARSTARLSHSGIITVFDVVEHDGVPMIVMELVHGRSLAQILKSDVRLPWRRAAEIGTAMLDALREAHAAGIVHRDLKPANVLITDRRVVITDFGIAQRSGQRNDGEPGEMTGTPAFMAPEQAEGAPASEAADLWSLGATLYNAVEGRPPYTGSDYVTVLLTLLTQDPPPPRAAGPLTPLLKTLLQRDPARRATAAHATTLLEQALATPTQSAPGPVGTEGAATPGGSIAGPGPTAATSGVPSRTSAGSGRTAASGTPGVRGGTATPSRSSAGSGGAAAPGAGSTPWVGAATSPLHQGYQIPGVAGLRPVRPMRPMRPVLSQPDGPIRRRLSAVLCAVLVFAFAIGMTALTSRSSGAHGVHILPAQSTAPSGAGQVPPLPGPEQTFSAAAFSPDGTLAAFALNGQAVRLYDVRTHKKVRDLRLNGAEVPQPGMALAFSPDGTKLAAGGGTGPVVVFNVKTGRRAPGSGSYAEHISEPRWAPDGASLWALDMAGALSTWDLDADWTPAVIPVPEVGYCRTAAMTQDTRRLACLDRNDVITILDITTDRVLARLSGSRTHQYLPRLLFSPDGKILAEAADGTTIWDLTTDTKIDITAENSEDPTTRLAFDPQSRILAIETVDNDIMLWRMTSSRLLMSSTNNIPAKVGAGPIAVSPDGRTLLNGSNDGVHLIDLGSHREVAHWPV